MFRPLSETNERSNQPGAKVRVIVGVLNSGQAISIPHENRPIKSRRVLLVSNRVMHYRVSVYNYFHRRFREEGWDFNVLANSLQAQNQHLLDFPFTEMPFRFSDYRREIRAIRPDAVILFLHLKNKIIWPLVHWLKLTGIPVIFWTKTRNLDDADNFLKNLFFNYMMHLCDGLILYTESLMENVPKNSRGKAFAANNAVNSEDFPEIRESKEGIKRKCGPPIQHFRKIVLFVGRMGEEGNRKKVDHLIEVFRELPDEEIGLVIVGADLPERLSQRLNPKNSIYLGEIHDPENREISRIFKMADICAIPGHVGLGLNQAMYWGLPVITEEGLQPPEIFYLKDGRNGFIVPSNDISALKEKILYLANNETALAEFSRNARDDIRRHASIEGMFQGFLNCVNYASKAQAA
jgi:glycosyltransferase involved in cell wall biosynthesis